MNLLLPSRDQDLILVDSTFVNKNLTSGKSIDIILDLNVLIRMESVISGKTSYADSELQPLIDLLNSCVHQNLSISGGNALAENHPDYAVGLSQSFEDCCRQYLPSYSAHPTNIEFKPEKYQKSTSHALNDLQTKSKHAINYHDLLFLNVKIRSGVTDFHSYYLKRAMVPVPISPWVTEIAKIFFCADPALSDDLKKIKANFFPKKSKFLMNASWDLTYLDFAVALSTSQNIIIIATLDDKLSVLDKYIYEKDGNRQYIRHNPSNYWQECDRQQDSLALAKRSTGFGKDFDLDQIEEKIQELLSLNLF